MRRRATWMMVVGTAACAVACNATPIPQPPPENLDVGKIVFPETQPATNQVGFSGEPGAAPANSTIRVTNLDSTDPVVAISVDADGSFQATISAEFNDEIRFQVRDGAERLTPIDLLYTGGFEEPLRVDCFEVALELDFGAVASGDTAEATLSLRNDCASDAQVNGAVFRTNDPAFEQRSPDPISVTAGGTVDLDMSFTAMSSGENEEVFLVSVSIDGAEARYPVTLHGTGQ